MSLQVKLICNKCGCIFYVNKKTAAKHKNDIILCRNCRISETKKNKSEKEKQIINEKRKATCLEKFGVDCCFNTEISRDNLRNIDWNKRNKKANETKKEKYGDKNFNNREKSLKTMIEKYGEHSSKNQKVKAKKNETCNQLFGGNSPMCDANIRKKSEKTKIEKYGNKNNIEKAKETWIRIYGVDNPMKNKDIVQKTIVSKHFDILKKRGLIFDEIYFDSSWELAFYIWLKDNNKQFIYHPNTPIEYLDDTNTIRFYYPDFLVEGKFIEIKGNQFFNEKEEPYNLYKKEYWWNKYNMLVNNNVYIMREKEAFTYVKYVNEKYGKNFIKSHKITKAFDFNDTN